MSLLEVSGLTGGYGPVQVLFGVDFRVGEREVVGLVGRNGMGKTTTIRMITGELLKSSGSLAFNKTDIAGASIHRIARMGIGLAWSRKAGKFFMI